MRESPPFVALKAAIAAAGSQRALSKVVGVTQQAISGWVARGNHLPAEHVLTVEAATGVSRHDLRPDIYPREVTVPAPDHSGGADDKLEQVQS